jgi:serine/threonine protein phosphatase PrpC
MIICPECGQAAEDGTKFCERCGQGIAAAPKAASKLAPLTPGTELKTGYKIVELIGQTFDENRYRVSRQINDAVEYFQLRERAAPLSEDIEVSQNVADTKQQDAAASTNLSPKEDPNGPRAKTRELKLETLNQSSGPSGNGGLAEVVQEQSKPELEESADQQKAGENSEAAGLVNSNPQHNGNLDQSDETAKPAQHLGEELGTSEEGGQTTEELPAEVAEESDDLGELFSRVLALSNSLKHPSFQTAITGFAHGDRIYLVYPDERLVTLSARSGGIKMSEADALNIGIQVCQAISFLNKRGLRLNDVCPASLVYGPDGRVKATGLDYISNDDELQSEPILNDGYTAPEIYRGKAVDKRADVFSVGCLLYTFLTGERIEAETWRGEAGPVTFYPPHVVTPEFEQVIRRSLGFKPSERWTNIDALKAELLKLNSSFTVRSGALTDVGMVREHNEDSLLVREYLQQSEVDPAETHLFVVSDGMGGAEAGETASAIAVATIRDYIEAALQKPEKDKTEKDRSQLLQSALEEANRKILEYQVSHPESRGMGATAVAVLVVPPDPAVVAWAGDSRVYYFDRGRLRQLTKDHSLVQRLVEIGQITPEEARHHEHKNVITRSLGARPQGPAGAEVLSARLKRGDRLLLCSDGLTAHVEDSQIAGIFARIQDPQNAARELVVAANAGGGTDNIAVITVFAD